MIPTTGRSADLAVDQRTSRDPATTPVAEVSKPAADDSLSYLLPPFKLASQPNLKQSVFGFVGRTDSGNLGSTFVYGVGAPERIFFDNYIVGGAYQRDFLQFNSGLLIGAEIGLADRFGHYSICCDTLVYSNSVVQSAEFWAGASIRTQGIALFDTVRVSPGFVFGLSLISNPIGQESEHQIAHQGSAKALFYLGFDLAFALSKMPDTELVFRIQHRSGAYGTLGAMKEGNNANVIGIRQRF
ncbi:MAG: hypothetical protein ACXWIU_11020 [Limisphaerales bacterium]